MCHRPFPSATATVTGNEIEIDFSTMPICQLVSLKRLGVGMTAQSCHNWPEAAYPAVRALSAYLDQGLEPVACLTEGFKVEIKVNREVDATFQAVVAFFAREGIRVEKVSGVRAA